MKKLRSKLEKRFSKSFGAVPSGQSPTTSAQQPVQVTAQPRGATLNIALQNNTRSNRVFAYVTGQAIDNGNAIVLIQADGTTLYYPSSPSGTLAPLQQDCAIPLGDPGSVRTIQIPHIAGGRIWFSVENKLNFFLNPGPALVEPSVTNPSDPSINIDWAFCEFTFNSDQLYANISYVDFVSLPIALTLVTANNGTQSVLGLPSDGLAQVANGLRAQQSKDNAGWDRLIVPNPADASVPLRILSPNNARVLNPNVLSNYFDSYVAEVFMKFQSQQLAVDTQAGFGVVTGQVSTGLTGSAGPVFQIGGSSFSQPSTTDIWTCSTGPFATGSNPETNAIIPRLSAAFNRSTLTATNSIPAPPNLYYQNPVTNHYSRILHSVHLDGKGYAFPYDDVQATGAPDASGKVQAGDPVLWTVAIGGSSA